MKESYEGDEGTPGWGKRKQAFLDQELLKGWGDSDLQEVARKLTNAATVEEYRGTEQLYQQDSNAEFVFFILKGSVDLKHDDEILFSPEEETSIGEYAAIDVGSTYYVSAIATKRTVAALVKQSAFERIAREHPNLWKGLARKLAGRMNFPRDFNATREHVVVLVHGIRTYSPWQRMVEAEFRRAGLTAYPTNFGFFDLMQFLVPLKGFRRKKYDEVYFQLRKAMEGKPNAPRPRISILAHSFGSYIVAEILADHPDIDVYRLAFCGSIVPYNHRFIRQLGPRSTTRVVNDIGTRDFWPALANSVTTGYGSAGTYGFNGGTRVTDRWFEGLGHSDFFQPAFCKKYWIPFFKDGSTEPDETISDPIEPAPRRLVDRILFLKKRPSTRDGFGRYIASPPQTPLLILAISSAPCFKIKVWLPLVALATLLWWKRDYLVGLLYRVCA